MNILIQILGRLHPLLVHLPIGFIILALLLSWYDRKNKVLTHGIALSFLWGGISGVFTCISGYLLYQTEGFSFETVKVHLWIGIITSLFCFITYVRIIGYSKLAILNKISLSAFFIILFILVSFTGHLGGNITHGEDYLLEPLPNSMKSILGIEIYEQKNIAISEETWENTVLYDDLIHPILNNKCLSCHSSKKAKGELILQSPETILIGGEKGEVIVANHPNKSSLYTRLELPLDNDDRMPPEGKTQLTKSEIRLISEWITHGNSFDKSIKELGLKKELFESFFIRKISNNYPDVYVEKAKSETINNIETYNVHVGKINEESHFLNVTCINQPEFNDKDLELLLPIANNIAMLDLGGTKI